MVHCGSLDVKCEWRDGDGNCLGAQEPCPIGKDRLNELEREAIKLKKRLMEVLDEIYEMDELEGDKINERLNDERAMRS